MLISRPPRLLLLLSSSLVVVVLLVSKTGSSFSTSSTSCRLMTNIRTRSINSRQETRILSVDGPGNDNQEGSGGSVLFDDHSGSDQSTLSDSVKSEAKFGQSVPLKKPSSDAKFGESVPLKKPAETDIGGGGAENGLFSVADSAVDDDKKSKGELQKMRERNIIVAIASVFLAVSSYMWQFTHPITPMQLLASMQSSSAPLTTIGTNGRPTVVDFWAPWCENCKLSAPTLQKLEEEYKDQVNFVMVNGDRPEAWPLIERFGVDAIPHLALISAEGDVETALIGPIPKRVLEADLNALISNSNTQEKKTELPFQMMDAFSGRPDQRRVHFDESSASK